MGPGIRYLLSFHTYQSTVQPKKRLHATVTFFFYINTVRFYSRYDLSANYLSKIYCTKQHLKCMQYTIFVNAAVLAGETEHRKWFQNFPETTSRAPSSGETACLWFRAPGCTTRYPRGFQICFLFIYNFNVGVLHHMACG